MAAGGVAGMDEKKNNYGVHGCGGVPKGEGGPSPPPSWWPYWVQHQDCSLVVIS